jgi:hypothetical protein
MVKSFFLTKMLKFLKSFVLLTKMMTSFFFMMHSEADKSFKMNGTSCTVSGEPLNVEEIRLRSKKNGVVYY